MQEIMLIVKNISLTLMWFLIGIFFMSIIIELIKNKK